MDETGITQKDIDMAEAMRDAFQASTEASFSLSNFHLYSALDQMERAKRAIHLYLELKES